MPFPRSYIYVAGMLLLCIPAFYPNYFSKLDSVAWQYHVHAVTAAAWLLLLIWQSYSIHHDRRAMHKRSGLLVMLIAPLFLAGSLLMLGTMVNRAGPFMELFADRLAIHDVITVATFACLIFAALRYRSNAHFHASCLLATPLLLAGPVFGRLFPGFVPGLTIRSVEEFPRFAYSIHASAVLSVFVALILYSRDRKNRSPFLWVALVIILESLLFETIGRTEVWSKLNLALFSGSSLVLAASGIGLGALAVYLGWTRPKAT